MKANSEMIVVITYSGYRSTRMDAKGAQHVLSAEVSDDTLGAAVLDALARSRFVLPAPPESGVWVHPEVGFDKDLYDSESANARYDAWVAEVMSRFKYKSKRAMFKSMKSCGIDRTGDSITIKPTHHEKLEAWSGDGISDDDYVVIAADSSAGAVGTALRLARCRCT